MRRLQKSHRDPRRCSESLQCYAGTRGSGRSVDPEGRARSRGVGKGVMGRLIPALVQKGILLIRAV